jgi:hypothetical protein
MALPTLYGAGPLIFIEDEYMAGYMWLMARREGRRHSSKNTDDMILSIALPFYE